MVVRRGSMLPHAGFGHNWNMPHCILLPDSGFSGMTVTQRRYAGGGGLFSYGWWGFGLFCLFGVGWPMEDALLPSNWLALFITGVPAVAGPLERAPPEREGLAAGRAFLLDYMSRTIPGQDVRQRLLLLFSGLYAAMGTTGPVIQLWPHSLTNDVLVCRSDMEQILRHPLAVAR